MYSLLWLTDRHWCKLGSCLSLSGYNLAIGIIGLYWEEMKRIRNAWQCIHVNMKETVCICVCVYMCVSVFVGSMMCVYKYVCMCVCV